MRYVTIFAVMMLLIAGACGSALALTEEEMLARYQASEVAFNAHDVDLWLSDLTDDAIHDYVPSPPPVAGTENMKMFMEAVFQAFPDGKMTTHRFLASEPANTQIIEWAFTGTLEGQWMGMGPTGESKGPIPHLTIDVYEGDNIKHLTTYFDAVTFMVQSGLMPPPDPLPPLVPSFTLPDPEPTGLAPVEAAQEMLARFNAQDLEGFTKMVHPSIEAFIAPMGIPLDRDSFIASLELYFVGFPDIQGEIVRTVDLGDGWVFTEQVYQGTNDGPFFGPATGKFVSGTRCGILERFNSDGILTEFRDYYDNLGMMIQMGLVPAPEPSAISPASWGEIKSRFR